jgi:hypothetical protein
MRPQIKILLIILSCVPAYLSEAQNSTFDWEVLNKNSNRLEGKLTGLTYRIPPLTNSTHFLQDRWVEGSILLEDGDLFDDVRIRYLSFHDELVAYNPNLKQLLIVDKEKVNSFTFNYPQGQQKFIKLYFDAFVDAGYRYFDLKYLNLPYGFPEKHRIYKQFVCSQPDSTECHAFVVTYYFSPAGRLHRNHWGIFQPIYVFLRYKSAQEGFI